MEANRGSAEESGCSGDIEKKRARWASTRSCRCRKTNARRTPGEQRAIRALRRAVLYV